MELAAGGSLRDVLHDEARALPWPLRVNWLAQIAEGMAELHAMLPRPIVHRDLKAANVLLSSADLGQAVAKVADFGVAKTMDTLRTTCATAAVGAGGTAGTLPWKAAETFKGKFTEASDVHAFGIMLFEVVSRTYAALALGHGDVLLSPARVS